MSAEMELRYRERLTRYNVASAGGKPDRVPIRLSMGEAQAKLAWFSLQEIYYQYDKNVAATSRVAAEFDVDAIRGAPSRFWAAQHDGVGTRYAAYPGLKMPEDTQYQYVEGEYMLASDYDEFIADPTRWIVSTYLPRVQEEYSEPGSYRATLALLKGMAAQHMFSQAMRHGESIWREEYGLPTATAGVCVAPFDVLGDKLRGMVGVLTDLHRRPGKILEAVEMLVPHMVYMGLGTSAGDTTRPLFMPLHRGSHPFLSPAQWDRFYWPSLKEVIEGRWAEGKRTLFSAEADWTPYLDRIAELPEGSIVFNIDKTDVAQTVKSLGGGGIDRCCSMAAEVNLANGAVRGETARDYGRY